MPFTNLGVTHIFGLQKIWQDILVAPADITESRPVIVVLSITSHIGHAVQATGTAHHPSSGQKAGLISLIPACDRFRLTEVIPVETAAAQDSVETWNVGD